MHKYDIRYIDEGLEKIKKYLEEIDLVELEILYSKFERNNAWGRVWDEKKKKWTIVKHSETCILWDREKIIEKFVGSYTIFSKGGLFEFMERETKGELKFGKF